jgi:hypothetical protein
MTSRARLEREGMPLELYAYYLYPKLISISLFTTSFVVRELHQEEGEFVSGKEALQKLLNEKERQKVTSCFSNCL